MEPQSPGIEHRRARRVCSHCRGLDHLQREYQQGYLQKEVSEVSRNEQKNGRGCCGVSDDHRADHLCRTDRVIIGDSPCLEGGIHRVNSRAVTWVFLAKIINLFVLELDVSCATAGQ